MSQLILAHPLWPERFERFKVAAESSDDAAHAQWSACRFPERIRAPCKRRVASPPLASPAERRTSRSASTQNKAEVRFCTGRLWFSPAERNRRRPHGAGVLPSNCGDQGRAVRVPSDGRSTFAG